MLRPIILLGRTPYSVELSVGLFKRSKSENPYKHFYGSPYEFRSNILDNPDRGLFKERENRVLQTYLFFYEIKNRSI